LHYRPACRDASAKLVPGRSGPPPSHRKQLTCQEQQGPKKSCGGGPRGGFQQIFNHFNVLHWRRRNLVERRAGAPATNTVTTLYRSVDRGVISTGDEKYARSARMTPRDIDGAANRRPGRVFRVCYGTDNCTASAHLLLRHQPRGFTRPSITGPLP
jgi:hypothetical protein